MKANDRPVPTSRCLHLALAASTALAGAATLSAQPPTLAATSVRLDYIGWQTQDFTIPDLVGAEIKLTVKGADGGSARRLRNSASGGQGATIILNARIGHASNALKPGGRLRFIVGQGGERTRNDRMSGAGGGGGTGVLYDTDAYGDDWAPLAVAGGGGGALRHKDSHRTAVRGGGDASLTSSGNAGGSRPAPNKSYGGAGGVNGLGGTEGKAPRTAGHYNCGGGGSGVFGDALDFSSTWSAKKGMPAGGLGGTHERDGGWGCGAGGAGNVSLAQGGGGGGGYSGGGGGGTGRAGGGGGSWYDSAFGSGQVFLGNDGHNGTAYYEITPVFSAANAFDLGVVGSAGVPIVIDTDQSTFDTTLTLFDSLGVVQEINDTAASGSIYAQIQRALPAGTYYVAVAGSPNSGSNGFQMNNAPSGHGWSSVHIYGYTDVDLLRSGEHKFYSFRIESPPSDAIHLGTIGLDGEIVVDTVGSDFDTMIATYDHQGNVIGINDNHNFTYQSRLARNMIPGRYYLLVTGYGSAPQAFFTRDTTWGNPGGNIVGRVQGTPFSGWIPFGGARFYSFDVSSLPQAAIDLGTLGSTGTIVSTTQSSSGFTTTSSIYDTSGRLLAVGSPDPASDSRLEVYLTAGDYYVAATAADNAPADFFATDTSNAPSGSSQCQFSVQQSILTISGQATLNGDETRFAKFTIVDGPAPCTFSSTPSGCSDVTLTASDTIDTQRHDLRFTGSGGMAGDSLVFVIGQRLPPVPLLFGASCDLLTTVEAIAPFAVNADLEDVVLEIRGAAVVSGWNTRVQVLRLAAANAFVTVTASNALDIDCP